MEAKIKINQANEILSSLLGILIPGIKRNKIDLYKYKENGLFPKYDISKFMGCTNKKGFNCLLEIIYNEESNEETVHIAKQLLISLAKIYYDKTGNISIILNLYNTECAFADALSNYGIYAPEMIAEMFYMSFKQLDMNLMDSL